MSTTPIQLYDESIDSIFSELNKGPDGIWHAIGNEAISYPQEGNDACFSVENTSWWFKHRNNCIVTIVKEFPPPSAGHIFDIGGGNGFVSAGLRDAGFKVALVEPGISGSRNAKNRGIETVICATTETAKFRQGSLPAAGLFDVIEHIENDKEFLQHINSLMKSDGILYITVPAYESLWSDEDIKAGHYRRYSKTQITRLLSESGFDVLYSTYFFRFLPLPILFLRALPHRLGFSRSLPPAEAVAKDHASAWPKASWILESLLSRELRNLRSRKPMKFGGSCLLVVKPKAGSHI